jgi:outer membrane protein assembly factor BamD
MHALRAEDECHQLLVQFPNSKFAPEAQQKLRDIQEVLADAEFRTASFYHNKGSFPASANRFQGVADQFPLFSQADESLWQLADSYQHMGDRFENQQVGALTRIVKDYPLSAHADAARAKLKQMNRPVPEADPVAYARMKYELENHTKLGLMGHFFGAFRTNPTMNMAAKSGSPQMTGLRPTIPASVPPIAAGTQGVSSEVSVSTVADSSAIDRSPDARANPPAPGSAAGDAATTVTATQPAPAPPPPVQQSTVTRTGVDINTASLAELQKLPGVGKLQAQRIAAMRPFLSIQDLIRTGLPQKTITNLKPAATAPAGSATPAPAKK